MRNLTVRCALVMTVALGSRQCSRSMPDVYGIDRRHIAAVTGQ